MDLIVSDFGFRISGLHAMSAFLSSAIPGHTPKRGKVRDMYDFGDRMLMVASDRISAFDWVLPSGIPDKGRVLTQLSRFWFEHLPVRHHLLSQNLDDIPLPAGTERDSLTGRSMVVRKTEGLSRVVGAGRALVWQHCPINLWMSAFVTKIKQAFRLKCLR